MLDVNHSGPQELPFCSSALNHYVWLVCGLKCIRPQKFVNVYIHVLYGKNAVEVKTQDCFEMVIRVQ